MELKPTITKSLNDRKVILKSKAEAIQTNLAEMETRTAALRKELEDAQTELADIDELLSAPPEK